MPLAFPSKSHGEIAFGFFNIDGDMLLLERTCFFADRFCAAVTHLAAADSDAAWEATIPAFHFDPAEDLGDLMGAIHGVRHTGFIGTVYRRYPFPSQPEAFRQKTRGFETRDEFRSLARPWSREGEVRLAVDPIVPEFSIGEVRFELPAFHELVRYVYRGGWPRWENEERPPYVDAMRTAVEAGHHRATRGINWSV